MNKQELLNSPTMKRLGAVSANISTTMHGTTTTLTFKVSGTKEEFTLRTFFHGYRVLTSTGTELLKVETPNYTPEALATDSHMVASVLDVVTAYVTMMNNLYTETFAALDTYCDTVAFSRPKLERGVFTTTLGDQTRTVILRKEVTLILQVKVARKIVASVHISEKIVKSEDVQVICDWIANNDIFDFPIGNHKHFQLFHSEIVRY